MFCKYPQGHLRCPCGALSPPGDKQALGYNGWLHGKVITHFTHEGQTLVGMCPTCMHSKLSERREGTWSIRPRNGESWVAFLDRLERQQLAQNTKDAR